MDPTNEELNEEIVETPVVEEKHLDGQGIKYLWDKMNDKKQETLIPGDNITIKHNRISAAHSWKTWSEKHGSQDKAAVEGAPIESSHNVYIGDNVTVDGYNTYGIGTGIKLTTQGAPVFAFGSGIEADGTGGPTTVIGYSNKAVGGYGKTILGNNNAIDIPSGTYAGMWTGIIGASNTLTGEGLAIGKYNSGDAFGLTIGQSNYAKGGAVTLGNGGSAYYGSLSFHPSQAYVQNQAFCYKNPDGTYVPVSGTITTNTSSTHYKTHYSTRYVAATGKYERIVVGEYDSSGNLITYEHECYIGNNGVHYTFDDYKSDTNYSTYYGYVGDNGVFTYTQYPDTVAICTYSQPGYMKNGEFYAVYPNRASITPTTSKTFIFDPSLYDNLAGGQITKQKITPESYNVTPDEWKEKITYSSYGSVSIGGAKSVTGSVSIYGPQSGYISLSFVRDIYTHNPVEWETFENFEEISTAENGSMLLGLSGTHSKSSNGSILMQTAYSHNTAMADSMVLTRGSQNTATTGSAIIGMSSNTAKACSVILGGNDNDADATGFIVGEGNYSYHGLALGKYNYAENGSVSIGNRVYSGSGSITIGSYSGNIKKSAKDLKVGTGTNIIRFKNPDNEYIIIPKATFSPKYAGNEFYFARVLTVAGTIYEIGWTENSGSWSCSSSRYYDTNTNKYITVSSSFIASSSSSSFNTAIVTLINNKITYNYVNSFNDLTLEQLKPYIEISIYGYYERANPDVFYAQKYYSKSYDYKIYQGGYKTFPLDDPRIDIVDFADGTINYSAFGMDALSLAMGLGATDGSVTVGLGAKAEHGSIALGITASGLELNSISIKGDVSKYAGYRSFIYNCLPYSYSLRFYNPRASHSNEASIAIGNNAYATHLSIGIGPNNFADHSSLAAGDGNKTANSGMAFGISNTADLASVTTGSYNSAIQGAFAYGSHNSSSESSAAFGSNNTAYNSGYSFGFGNETSEWGFAYGSYNKAWRGSAVFGSSNVAAEDSFSFGASNRTIFNASAFGKNNYAAHNSLSVGNNGYASNASLVIGSGDASDLSTIISDGIQSSYSKIAHHNSILFGSGYIDGNSIGIGFSNSNSSNVWGLLVGWSNYQSTMSGFTNGHGIMIGSNNTAYGSRDYAQISPDGTHSNSFAHNIAIGAKNALFGANLIAIGAENYVGSSNPSDWTADKGNDGFAVAIGFRNYAVRNYDMAIGFCSYANGGENIAITNSTAYGYRNLSYNKSIIGFGVGNILLNQSQLTTSNSSIDRSGTTAFNNILHNAQCYVLPNRTSTVRYENDTTFSDNMISNSILDINGTENGTYNHVDRNIIMNTAGLQKYHIMISSNTTDGNWGTFADNIIIGRSKSNGPVATAYACFDRNIILHSNMYQSGAKTGMCSWSDNILFGGATMAAAVNYAARNIVGMVSSISGTFNHAVADNIVLGHSELIGANEEYVSGNILLCNSKLIADNTQAPTLTYCGSNVLIGSDARKISGVFSFSDGHGYYGTDTHPLIEESTRIFNFGDNNILRSTDGSCFGENNNIQYQARPFISGANNNIITYPLSGDYVGSGLNSSSNTVFGDQNAIFGPKYTGRNFISGSNNVMAVNPNYDGYEYTTGNTIFGDDNKFVNEYRIIHGMDEYYAAINAGYTGTLDLVENLQVLSENTATTSTYWNTYDTYFYIKPGVIGILNSSVPISVYTTISDPSELYTNATDGTLTVGTAYKLSSNGYMSTGTLKVRDCVYGALYRNDNWYINIDTYGVANTSYMQPSSASEFISITPDEFQSLVTENNILRNTWYKITNTSNVTKYVYVPFAFNGRWLDSGKSLFANGTQTSDFQTIGGFNYQYNMMVGCRNLLTSNSHHNFVFGGNNTIDGAHSRPSAETTLLTAWSHNVIFGTDNYAADGSYQLLVGDKNIALGPFAVGLGCTNIVNQNQVVIGSYNEELPGGTNTLYKYNPETEDKETLDPTAGALFIVGNGYDTADPFTKPAQPIRSNAMVVWANGTVEAKTMEAEEFIITIDGKQYKLSELIKMSGVLDKTDEPETPVDPEPDADSENDESSTD